MNDSFPSKRWAHKTSLNLPILFIDMGVPTLESERFCICVMDIHFASVSTNS